MFIHRSLLLVLLVLFSRAALAQQPDDLQAQADAAYARKAWADAAVLYERLAAADPAGSGPAYYNAGCSHALAGHVDAAFKALAAAVENGYARVAQFKQDNDLVSLRSDSRWQPLLAKAAAEEKRLDAVWNTPALNTPFAANISEDEKVAGLSKFWAEVRYNFAFPERLPQIDWDGLYLAYLPKVRATKTTEEYYRLLQELCARLADGHTNVYPPQPLWDRTMAVAPIRTRLVDGHVVVVELFDASRAPGVSVGDEVVRVDGVPVREYAEKRVRPYQSASTEQDRDTRTYEYGLLAGAANEPVILDLRSAAGTVSTVTLSRVSMSERAKLAPRRASFEWRMLPGNVAYVALNQFETSEAADAFEKNWEAISKATALILDIRNNGGGNSSVGYRVLATLTDKPFKGSKWSTREYRPTYRAWGRPDRVFSPAVEENPPDGTRLYKGRVAVLTSARTFSAAEDFAVAFDQMRRGIIIGEPTGGSTGQPLMLTLPGGGSARICTKRDTYADGRPFVGVGVQPGQLVRPTLADVRAGRDTVLDAAVTALSK